MIGRSLLKAKPGAGGTAELSLRRHHEPSGCPARYFSPGVLKRGGSLMDAKDDDITKAIQLLDKEIMRAARALKRPVAACLDR
jgi:hypothetical protein